MNLTFYSDVQTVRVQVGHDADALPLYSVYGAAIGSSSLRASVSNCVAAGVNSSGVQCTTVFSVPVDIQVFPPLRVLPGFVALLPDGRCVCGYAARPHDAPLPTDAHLFT